MTIEEILFDTRALKDPRLIVMVHDLLARALSGVLPLKQPLSDFDRITLSHYVAVLCWVLGHDADADGAGARFHDAISLLVRDAMEELQKGR